MIIDRIWSQQPGKYFCLSTKSGSDKWEDHFFQRGEFREIPTFLKDNADKQIYFCPHGFSKPRRLKPYAVLPKLLWSDLDEADPRTIKLKPTVAIESSPGRFVGLWFTDSEVSEDLNRRMSYFVGADKSGWDLTQVLRVPGTINYKYHTMPKVRLMWTDGPSYKISELGKKLPQETTEEESGTVESDAAEIFKRYEKKLPHWCRREILSGKPTAGKRSEMFWKLGQTLVETGLTTDEAFVLLKASPWNKFAGRRNEDVQLQRELDKAINKHLVSGPRSKRADPKDSGKAGNPDDEPKLIFRNMRDVEEENIDWIWPSRLAFGEVTILEGDPGLGKSYLMQMIAAYVCDGKKLPCDLKGGKPVKGKVVYFDMENSAGTVTKKRLVANGVQNLENYIQCEEPFSIDNEEALDEVYDFVEEHRPVLVVFDTMNTYLGGADAFKGHEVIQTFNRFREIAKRFHCGVVLLRHLTKAGKERAIYRGQGSISIAGGARIIMTAGVSPEDPDTRVVAVTKINIGPAPQAMEFRILGKPTLADPYNSEFEFGDFVDVSADDIVAAPAASKNTDRDDAIAFLEAQLDEGPIEVGKLEKMAEARSISRRTLHRAADSINVEKKSKGFGKDKRSYWSLPGEIDENV